MEIRGMPIILCCGAVVYAKFPRNKLKINIKQFTNMVEDKVNTKWSVNILNNVINNSKSKDKKIFFS